MLKNLLLGGRLNSRHGRETHGITVGTQENRISRHRQISQHKKQITMGTAHSSHPMTSPDLNKPMRTLWKTTRKSIRKEHSANQITMGTAHSSHPMTSPNLNKTMRALWKTTRAERDGNEIQGLPVCLSVWLSGCLAGWLAVCLSVSRLPWHFAHLHLLSSISFLVLSSTLLFSAFHLSKLSEVWLLNFLWNISIS